jgi:hypothetical protein
VARIALTVALLVLITTACGQARAANPQPNSGPPDAFIEFGSAPHRMLQGSSCWQNGTSERCADAAGLADILPLMPRLVITRGSAAHIHLGFDPTTAHLEIAGHQEPVSPGRTVTFTPGRAGVINLWLDAPAGSAEYFARISFGS